MLRRALLGKGVSELAIASEHVVAIDGLPRITKRSTSAFGNSVMQIDQADLPAGHVDSACSATAPNLSRLKPALACIAMP